MKKLYLLLIVMLAINVAVSAQDTDGEIIVLSTDSSSQENNDGSITVGGTIYFIRPSDNVKVAIYGVGVTIESDQTYTTPITIYTNSNGYYSFSCAKGEKVQLTLTPNSDNYYVPMDKYSFEASDEVYNIQLLELVDSNKLSRVPVKFNITLDGIAVADLPIEMTPVIEHATVTSFKGLTDSNGVCILGADAANEAEIPYAYIYYNIVMDKQGSLYKAETDYIYPNAEDNTECDIVLNFEKFICKLNCTTPTVTNDGNSNSAPNAPTVQLEFFDEENQPVTTPEDYEMISTYSAGTQSVTSDGVLYVGDPPTASVYIPGYKVRAKARGFYQSDLTSATDGKAVRGVKWTEVPSTNNVVINMQKYNPKYTLTPISKDEAYIKLEFADHKLKYRPTSDPIVLQLVDPEAQDKPRNQSQQMRTAETSNTVWSDKLIPMYAEQGSDGVINIYKDQRLSWNIELRDNSLYNLIMPKESVTIDNYDYPYDDTFEIPIEVGVFSVDAETDSHLVDVYNTVGMMVLHNVDENNIKDLPSGIYIVKSKAKAYKIINK